VKQRRARPRPRFDEGQGFEHGPALAWAGSEENRHVASHQLHFEPALEVVQRRRRRFAHQVLEARPRRLVLQRPDRIVEDDRQPPALLHLALHENHLPGARRLLPVDAARIVARTESTQRVQVVSPSSLARGIVSPAPRLAEPRRGSGVDLGKDQQFEAQRIAQPLAEEAERKERRHVPGVEAVPPPPLEQHLDPPFPHAARRQVGQQPRRRVAGDGEL
jgi:hypothetical protein